MTSGLPYPTYQDGTESRLPAVPATAAQRPSLVPQYDSHYDSSTPPRPTHWQQQPHIDGNDHTRMSAPVAPPTFHRASSDYGRTDAYAGRRSIDYPRFSNDRPVSAGRALGPVPQPPPPAAMARPSIVSLPTRSSSQDVGFAGPPGTAALAVAGYDFGDEPVPMTGLKNLGNTCYMNSTLQCLSATIPLSRFLRYGKFRPFVNRTNRLGTGGQLVQALAELLATLWKEQYYFVSPLSFRVSRD